MGMPGRRRARRARPPHPCKGLRPRGRLPCGGEFLKIEKPRGCFSDLKGRGQRYRKPPAAKLHVLAETLWHATSAEGPAVAYEAQPTACQR
jgi:hypothetical protein